MMTQAKNTDAIINEYLKIYPPYHSTQNLGVNVSEILKIAKKHGKRAAELTESELEIVKDSFH